MAASTSTSGSADVSGVSDFHVHDSDTDPDSDSEDEDVDKKKVMSLLDWLESPMAADITRQKEMSLLMSNVDADVC